MFPGTRGEIASRSNAHYRHTCLLIEAPKGRVLIDFGKDWAGKWGELSPDKLLLTHAHPDHVGGLTRDPGCLVYASEETWSRVSLPIAKARLLRPNKPLTICGLRFRAIPVEHSLRAPAVGLRIGTGSQAFFYASDVLKIPEVRRTLKGARLYIGDGASATRPLVRKLKNAETGHASIRQQLEWCAEASVPEAVFTHCGSPLVKDSTGELHQDVQAMGKQLGVKVSVAHDGMEFSWRGSAEGEASQ